MKAERQRIRQQVREGYLNLKRSFAPLPELIDDEKCLKERQSKHTDQYEDEEVKVEIVQFSTKEMAARNHLLGENSAIESSNAELSFEPDDNEQEVESIYRRCQSLSKLKKKHKLFDLNPNRVPGMEIDDEDEQDANDEMLSRNKGKCPNLEAKVNLKSNHLNKYRTKKDIDRLKKNKCLKEFKKSKIFKIKERLDKQANRKRIKREQNKTLRNLPKHIREQKRNGASTKRDRYRKGRLLNKKQLRTPKQ